MKHIIKIFVTGNEQKAVLSRFNVIARYTGFIVVGADEKTAKQLAREYLVEDITKLFTIRFGESTIDTSVPRLDEKGKIHAHPAYKKGEDKKSLPVGKHHFLVQFIGPVKKEWLSGIVKAGAELREPYGDFAYVIRVNDKSAKNIIALPYVKWLGHLPYRFRVESNVTENINRKTGDISSALPRTKIIPGQYVIEFFGADDIRKAIPLIKKLGFEVLSHDMNGKVIVVKWKEPAEPKISGIDGLSAIPGVKMVREKALKRISNDVATGLMGTAKAMGNSSGNLGLSGSGEYISICDTGLDTGNAQTIHQDFANRVVWIKSYPILSDYNRDINNPGANDGAADLDSGHGTHVAGSFTGSGAASSGLNGLAGPVRGCAYKAKLVFQAVEQEMKWKNPADYKKYGRYILSGLPNDIGKIFSDARARKVRIHSNSWGGGDPGVYDEQCNQLDQFIWDYKDACILFAAGNDGTDSDGDGKINPMSVTAPGTAKNCITIGATENRRTNFNNEKYGDWWPQDYPVAPYHQDPMANDPEQIAAFSSRGPTKDNRIKPDVCAPGTFILSTRSTMIAANNTAWAPFPLNRYYFYMGGTSMATPLAAGSTALIREFLRTKKNIKTPTAALVKAALIAGAKMVQGTPANVVFDYNQGYGRINIDAVVLPESPATAIFLEIRQGLTTGKVYTKTITIKSGKKPLRIVMAYTDFPGSSLVNNLNLVVTAPDGKKYCGNQKIGGSPAVDSQNNVEVLQVNNPLAGDWSITVIGANVPHGPQPFALVGIAHF